MSPPPTGPSSFTADIQLLRIRNLRQKRQMETKCRRIQAHRHFRKSLVFTAAPRVIFRGVAVYFPVRYWKVLVKMKILTEIMLRCGGKYVNLVVNTKK